MPFSMNPLRIVIIYALFASLWIYFSDHAVEYFVDNVTVFATLSTYKGFFFILITSLMLYGLIKAKMVQIESIQRKLKENEQRLEYVIHGADLGYWDWDYVHNKHIVNDKWLAFLGLKPEDIKEQVEDWSLRIHPDDLLIAQKAIEYTIEHDKPYVIEFRMRHQDGHWVWIEGSGAVVERDEKTDAPLRLAGTHRDISDRKNAENEMRFLALNDPLTKLPNRIYLRQELEKRLLETIEVTFLFLDLDRFKTINDTYGHTLGDQVIQIIAKRLHTALSQHDFLARVGGDEFVIISQNVISINEMCERLLTVVEEPIHIEAEEFRIGASIGIAFSPKDGMSFEALFKNADTAMYEAKKSIHKHYLAYQPSMTEELVMISSLDNDLKRGIDAKEFMVYFQPQIDLENDKIIGLEALVRWQHPQKGIVMPDTFIKRAEETRLIIPLGLLIFDKALEHTKQLKSRHLFEGTIAINISSVQIEEDNFVDAIETIRLKHEIAAIDIELEITESCFMSNPRQFAKTLQKLENLGYKISIDDFGTGYSSLNYLKQLPLHKLKIDRSFIQDLPEDSDDKAISKAIIALAKALDLEVLAEGVETEAQKTFLIENGCDSMQGYLFSKPLAIKDLEEKLRQN